LLVGGLKFHGKLAYGRLLTELMAEYLEPMLKHGVPELIVPVPLHPTRLRSRGYNQALELAHPLGRHLGIPIAPFICRRQRNTAPQVKQAMEGRHSNIQGAFQVVGRIQARHVALVDDVVTTGATVAELARTLKRAGVERVDVWAVARTPSG
jgi:ComF family protein